MSSSALVRPEDTRAVQEASRIVDQGKSAWVALLPEFINEKQWSRTVVGALRRDPKLAAAAVNNPVALGAALSEAARKGLAAGTDEFYLTIRKNKGQDEILGIEGYRGIVERMYRSGAVASVTVREVCEGDEFIYEGQDEKPTHKVDWFGGTRGAMVGVYAYAQLTTGGTSRVVILDRNDVMAVKAQSPSRNSEHSPWNALDGGPDKPGLIGRSMWWKTALRRLEPWVPTSNEYRKDMLRAASEVAQERQAQHSAAPAPPQPVTPDTSDDEGVVDGEIVDDKQPATPPEPERPPGRSARAATQQQIKYLGDLCGELSITDLAAFSTDALRTKQADHPEVTSVDALTKDEASFVIQYAKGLLEPAERSKS